MSGLQLGGQDIGPDPVRSTGAQSTDEIEVREHRDSHVKHRGSQVLRMWRPAGFVVGEERLPQPSCAEAPAMQDHRLGEDDDSVSLAIATAARV
jgi:hypothetical protein